MTAGIPNARPVIEKISLENVLEMRSILVEDEPEQDVDPAAEQADQETQQNGSVEAAGKEGALRSIQEFIGTSLGVPDLLQTGLLVSRKGGRAALVHPVFSAYLAGRCLAGQDSRQALFEQRTWTGKTLTLRYLSLFSDLTSYVQANYENCDDPSYRNWLQVWQWLRDLPKQVKWRSMVMRRTAAAVQDENLAVSLRARGITALTSTRDPGAGVLFRSFLQHPEPSVRQLGCLGCGLIRETKSVPDLATCMDDTDTRVIKAAMLALGAVSTAPALEALANGLLHGTEDVRRTAAEVLASLPGEGHPALVEGSTMEDLLVRRAVVYGLGRIREPWAKQLIEKMQVEDKQWVVQAAASQVLEELNKPDPHIPRRMPPPTELPWLIVFAGKQGMGVPPGKAALDLAVQAVNFGEEQEKLSALEYISMQADADKAHTIYPILFSDHGDLREAAYYTLWSLSGTGAKLPSPVQYGMG
jgi:HEAT repeat protein